MHSVLSTTLFLASATESVTRAVAEHGVLAVFALMAVDALLPVGGELVMLYAGVLAAGAVAGADVQFFGASLATGAVTYVVLALAGALGYLAGSLAGWEIGRRGGPALIARHGALLHLPPARFRRAEAWFARYGNQAVFLGRITPLVRSFISIPAGVLGTPLPSYLALTLAGSALWCFGFAGAGWAAGGAWKSIDHSLHYIDYAVVAVAILGAGWLLHRQVRRRRAG
jgi:membrane protein DedA with SNARE-associated domain